MNGMSPGIARRAEDLYFIEKAAQTLTLARATGEPLAVLSDVVAQNTADGWIAYRGMAVRHFDYLKSQLPRSDPSHACPRRCIQRGHPCVRPDIKRYRHGAVWSTERAEPR